MKANSIHILKTQKYTLKVKPASVYEKMCTYIVRFKRYPSFMKILISSISKTGIWFFFTNVLAIESVK